FKGDTYPLRTYALWIVNDGRVLLQTGNAAGLLETQTPANTILANQWYHLAAVIDRDSPSPRFSLYVHDATGAVRSFTEGPIPGSQGGSTTNRLYIGWTNEASPFYTQFRGTIDDVRIWSIPRAAAEI